jgi:hypothetical protein
MDDFVRSSFCNSGSCVEVGRGDCGEVLVRNSDYPELVVTFTSAEWHAFLMGVRSGKFDLEAPRTSP